jgi:hypothetical protein
MPWCAWSTVTAVSKDRTPMARVRGVTGALQRIGLDEAKAKFTALNTYITERGIRRAISFSFPSIWSRASTSAIRSAMAR